MATKSEIAQRLRQFRAELARHEAFWRAWSKFETWMASFRPYLLHHFPDHVSHFDELCRQPQWLVCSPNDPVHEGKTLHQRNNEELQVNNPLAQGVKERLLAFVQTLIELTNQPTLPQNQQQVEIPNQAGLERMPFRPYKRYVAQSFSSAEYHDHLQKVVLESGAEEEELRRLGGRSAVVASIRKHMPSFDPEEAQEPYDPAWAALKPILVKCGLNPVDENTTLTDIKAFLDATPLLPPVQPLAVERDQSMPNPRDIFVIHGRNVAARDAMFDFLRATGLNPIEWGEAVKITGKGSPYIGEVLDAAFGTAQAVVALLTADDVACLREELQQEHDPEYEKNPTPQARPNVLFEAGMAFGRHPERTIIVEIGQLRPFSDMAGKHAIRFRGTSENRTELRDRLKTAGCAVKDAGTDWLKAGNFDEALRLAGPITPRSARKKRS
jgi:predicted nucleotide-binding protein